MPQVPAEHYNKISVIFFNITTLLIALMKTGRHCLKRKPHLHRNQINKHKTPNIMNTKQNKITKFLYSPQLQTHDNSNKKSEMKWTNVFLGQNIVWDSAYVMAVR